MFFLVGEGLLLALAFGLGFGELPSGGLFDFGALGDDLRGFAGYLIGGEDG